MTKLKNIKYKLGKGLAFAGLAALPFAGCDKTKDDNGTKPTETPKKHNVELRYYAGSDEGIAHIAMDTIHKYNADPNVDSILMIADPYDQFETWDARTMNNVVNYLDARIAVNPNKVFGKGKLLLKPEFVEQNPDIVARLTAMGYVIVNNLL